jgi:hypothetical protein
MKKDYLFKNPNNDRYTKMIANTKKNTPFDIISKIQWYKQVMSIKN